MITSSVLLHECGHASIARIWGVNVKAVGLSFKGGYTVRERSHRVAVEALTTLAGPCVNLGLYLVFAHIAGRVSAWVSFSNLVLLVANLIPLGPSDGFRLWQLIRSF